MTIMQQPRFRDNELRILACFRGALPTVGAGTPRQLLQPLVPARGGTRSCSPLLRLPPQRRGFRGIFELPMCCAFSRSRASANGVRGAAHRAYSKGVLMHLYACPHTLSRACKIFFIGKILFRKNRCPNNQRDVASRHRNVLTGTI